MGTVICQNGDPILNEMRTQKHAYIHIPGGQWGCNKYRPQQKLTKYRPQQKLTKY